MNVFLQPVQPGKAEQSDRAPRRFYTQVHIFIFTASFHENENMHSMRRWTMTRGNTSPATREAPTFTPRGLPYVLLLLTFKVIEGTSYEVFMASHEDDGTDAV